MGEEDQTRYEHASEEEGLNPQKIKVTKEEREVEGSQGEVLASAATKIKKKEKLGRWQEENGDLRLGWVTLMEEMLKALKEKASDKDPKQEIVDLEDHLREVKSRATEWQGLAKEKMTIMDKSKVAHKGGGMGKRIDKKEKNKKIYQRRDITKVVNKTSEGDSKKNDQTHIFPLQSFSKAPTASKRNIVQKFLSEQGNLMSDR